MSGLTGTRILSVFICILNLILSTSAVLRAHLSVRCTHSYVRCVHQSCVR